MSIHTVAAGGMVFPVKSPENAPAPAPAPAVILGSTPHQINTYSTTHLNFAWVGILGLLVAFLTLAVTALVCCWYKKWADRKVVREERVHYGGIAALTSNRKEWVDDEISASKRGQMILAGFEQALVSETPSKRLSDVSIKDVILTMNMEQDIPVYTKDIYLSGGFNWNPDENLVDEVFYTGEEGSQMGVRYNRAGTLSDLETLDLMPKVALAGKVESDSVSLLGSLNRSHTIDPTSAPTKSGWSLRTFSLPSHYQKSSLGSRDVMKEGDVVQVQTKIKTIHAPHPTSLPASPIHHYKPSDFGNLTASPWAYRPSRLSHPTNYFYDSPPQRSSFIVPPSIPPPPLPLPVTVDGMDEQEKCVQEIHSANKLDDSRWSNFSYCPSPPPPPLPIPFEAPPAPPPPPLPRRSPLGLRPAPPPPPGLLNKTYEGVRSPPPSGLPKTTDIGVISPTLPTPPPPPLSQDGSGKPPPPPPLGGPRPKLAPLLLPGSEGSGTNPSSPKRTQKMRPLHWEKLKPESSISMVWDNISDSMELDVEMIENLFGVTSRASGSEDGKKSSSVATPEKHEILDPRKAHNIAIQLRARGLSRFEVCDALMEGDGLSRETLEVLVKMSPTDEEVLKFEEYQGDPSMLGPAERFLLGVLQVPSAFQRLDTLLYKASFKEELQHIQETISILEMACKELKGSRTFIKLLEAVLKTGNRLNMGTFRGEAKAFKLDTLLKLADVKGVDGKTTLLHFVIQEIIKAEGTRAARRASLNEPTTPSSTTSMSTASSTITSPSSSTSPLSHFARSMEAELERCQRESSPSSEGRYDYRKIGVDVVRGIPTELDNVRKAGGLDIVALRLAVSKQVSGLEDMKATLEKLLESKIPSDSSRRNSTYDLTDDVFREKLLTFLKEAAPEVGVVQRDLDLVLASVKDISIYFYGDAASPNNSQPLRVFLVMREFLVMLEQACKDVLRTNTTLTQSPSKLRN